MEMTERYELTPEGEVEGFSDFLVSPFSELIAGCDDVALGSFTQHNARLTVYPIFLPRSS
jgi:hypothetical protein